MNRCNYLGREPRWLHRSGCGIKRERKEEMGEKEEPIKYGSELNLVLWIFYGLTALGCGFSSLKRSKDKPYFNDITHVQIKQVDGCLYRNIPLTGPCAPAVCWCSCGHLPMDWHFPLIPLGPAKEQGGSLYRKRTWIPSLELLSGERSVWELRGIESGRAVGNGLRTPRWA